MGDTFRKQLTGMCLLVAACGVFWSCSLQEEAPLRAEVKMARESVYVLNKGGTHTNLQRARIINCLIPIYRESFTILAGRS